MKTLRRTLFRRPQETSPVTTAAAGRVDPPVGNRPASRSTLVVLDAEQFVALAARMQIPAGDAIHTAMSNVNAAA